MILGTAGFRTALRDGPGDSGGPGGNGGTVVIRGPGVDGERGVYAPVAVFLGGGGGGGGGGRPFEVGLLRPAGGGGGGGGGGGKRGSGGGGTPLSAGEADMDTVDEGASTE